MEEVFLDLRGRGLTAEGTKEMFPQPDYFVAVIDGAAVPGKAELMAALSSAFGFPSYFGRNWDALLDCLRSLPLSLKPPRGYALVVLNSRSFLVSSEKDKEDFADVAAEAAAFLGEKEGLRLVVALL